MAAKTVSIVLGSVMEKLCLRCPVIPATCYQADSSRRKQHRGNGWRAGHREACELWLEDAGDFSGSDLVDLQRVAAFHWPKLKGP